MRPSHCAAVRATLGVGAAFRLFLLSFASFFFSLWSLTIRFFDGCVRAHLHSLTPLRFFLFFFALFFFYSLLPLFMVRLRHERAPAAVPWPLWVIATRRAGKRDDTFTQSLTQVPKKALDCRKHTHCSVRSLSPLPFLALGRGGAAASRLRVTAAAPRLCQLGPPPASLPLSLSPDLCGCPVSLAVLRLPTSTRLRPLFPLFSLSVAVRRPRTHTRAIHSLSLSFSRAATLADTYTVTQSHSHTVTQGPSDTHTTLGTHTHTDPPRRSLPLSFGHCFERCPRST